MRPAGTGRVLLQAVLGSQAAVTVTPAVAVAKVMVKRILEGGLIIQTVETLKSSGHPWIR